MVELQELKRAARAQARHMLSKMDPKRREGAALNASRILRSSNIWATCDCLLAYMPLGAELDCTPAIRLALNDSKRVFIPKIFARNMVFLRILSANGPFEKGAFGIREPVVGKDLWRPGDGLSLVLTPGMLFDEDGGRLGRGGGFFDRFISKFRFPEVANPLFIGYAYDEQIVKKVPRGSGDERLDGVLSDLRFLRHSDG